MTQTQPDSHGPSLQTGIVAVFSTLANQEDARQIAAVLVERKLAACVQIDGPIESHYRWAGKIEASNEWRLSAKTTPAKLSLLMDALSEAHPYDEPEILYQFFDGGSDSYQAWVREQVDG